MGFTFLRWPRLPSPMRLRAEGELSFPLVRSGFDPPGERRRQSTAPLVALSLWDRMGLALQTAIGRMTVLVYAPLVVFVLRWVMGYTIRDLDTVRRRFLEIRERHPGPLLVCPNHLTMIDSAIVAWGLASPVRYAFRYRLLPWNLPERNNFANPIVRTLCYLAKCLPIHRGGARGPQQAVLAKCVRLLRAGHPVLVFPEGRRSRTGGIDTSTMAQAVGRLVRSVPGCGVLCIYLRGDGQVRHSSVPRRGESFSMQLELIRPHTTSGGVRGSREITTAVLTELTAMEQIYHARRQ